MPRLNLRDPNMPPHLRRKIAEAVARDAMRESAREASETSGPLRGVAGRIGGAATAQPAAPPTPTLPPPPRDGITSEAVLQREILLALRLEYGAGLLFFHVPNGGSRHKLEAAVLKGLGVLAGVADIIIALPPTGRLAGLEVKMPQGSQSKQQVVFADRLAKAGGVYAVARSVEEAVAIVREWIAAEAGREDAA